MRFGFASPEDMDPLSKEIASEWFMKGGMRRYVETNPSAFSPYTAEGMTRQLVVCFNAAL